MDTLHRYIALPESAREALRAFLTMVADCPDSVVANVSSNGDDTFSSSAVAQLMNKMSVLRANADGTGVSH